MLPLTRMNLRVCRPTSSSSTVTRDASIPQVWWPDGGYKRLFLRHSHVNVKITIFKILQRACWGTEPYVALH